MLCAKKNFAPSGQITANEVRENRLGMCMYYIGKDSKLMELHTKKNLSNMSKGLCAICTEVIPEYQRKSVEENQYNAELHT